MRLVLASQSPSRRMLLEQGGVEPVLRPAHIDEEAVIASLHDAPPATTVATLARAKAETAIAEFPDDVVVGCDSMLLCDGNLVGKPADSDSARAQWAAMAAGSSDLLTGHAVLRVHDGSVTDAARGTERTVIRFGRPDPEELEAYLATGEPLQVAGSLTIDGYGGWFVDGIDGDHSSVIGISLPLTRRLLSRIGVRVTDLWNIGRGAPTADRRGLEEGLG